MEKLTKLQKEEKNDCVVKAISNAYGMTYNQAHAYAKKNLDRKDKTGTKGNWVQKIVYDKEMPKSTIMGEMINGAMGMFTHYKNVRTGTEIVCAMTVGTFLDMHKEGTYIIQVRRHAFVIKNGEILGNKEDAKKMRTIVKTAIKVESETKTSTK